MALKAHLQPASSSGSTIEARRAPRRTLMLEASGRLPGSLDANVLIHNISAAGLLIETDLPLDEKERLVLDLPEAGAAPVVVVWKSARLFGCAFENMLSQGDLAAVQLRGTEPSQTPAASPGNPTEPFGARLNRLRRERGLTLAQVASVLGVSKPTVWAWEKGKARPVPERLDAIAETLGVEAAELQETSGDSQHAALVEDCRLRIATAYGTRLENIRIMIEV